MGVIAANKTTPLLTVAIPTFNRVEYLKALVDCLVSELDGVEPGEVELLVSDNASTDGTQFYLMSESRVTLRYLRQARNIGGDANFVECVRSARGRYVWLIGDDELVERGCLANLLSHLARSEPGLVILVDPGYRARMPAWQDRFTNYRELIRFAVRRHPHFILAHTLISANVFHRGRFDVATAKRYRSTNYGHMYALVPRLNRSDLVLVPSGPSIIVRDVRAEFQETITGLSAKQARYLVHVGLRSFSPGLVGFGLKMLLVNPFLSATRAILVGLLRKSGMITIMRRPANDSRLSGVPSSKEEDTTK